MHGSCHSSLTEMLAGHEAVTRVEVNGDLHRLRVSARVEG